MIAQALPNIGDVVCRYKAKAPPAVNYYTCTELAMRYANTVENFFTLNPSVKRDCSNITPNAEYCVKGCTKHASSHQGPSILTTACPDVQYPVSTDGFCGPKHGNESCSGTDFQCCNSETWSCGDKEEDCAPGTCWEGACTGFPSEYSMDGKCGPAADGLLCGGKWGDCCNSQGMCGAGDDFCSFERCYSGNCTIPPPRNTKLPWQTGTTPDGTCGGANGYTCDVVFGNCCSKNGTCGALVEHCGSGW
ncbi:hypothetical protein TOPH_00685 [Tolypocladium ophioglossoides CBS 100239]|uniref:Chitin-binding type-1 domain-containing protein n=1 Tax=Tolypocladium ophioglossoides (strain CBS 100239) TaxID=1163406 RepID=A0A0L0NNN1_TOLOC|nr:hypothetical protein TOPH_00685 [Tolypocladium ophioglossoides CBS 100239]